MLTCYESACKGAVVTEIFTTDKVQEITNLQYMNNPKGFKARFQTVFGFTKEVFSNFSDDKVLKFSAALSYYTVFSIAPLLTIVISVFANYFGLEAVQGKIFGQINGLVGADAAKQIQEMISNTHQSGNSFIASVISAIILVIVATGIFVEIQDSINSIWGLKSKPKSGIVKMLLNRVISFSLIISLGFIAIVSLVLDAAVAAISELMARIPGAGLYFIVIIKYALNFTILSFMFAVIFKVLPDAKIKLRDVIKGAMLTAVLFIIGKFGIGLYVSKTNLGSVYGAAGSIVVILVWVYYTAVILYLGAEFTKVYSIKYGSKITPNNYAVWVKTTEDDDTDKTLVQVKSEEKSSQDAE